MRRSRLPTVARQLLAEIPDADLLERYVQDRTDDAFAQLVTRYSRLVWGQCRNLLPGDADADDAFQATFLTLARSAKSIRPGAPLGPWLHGVAYRVCGNARRAMGRRAKREKACATPEADRPVADSTWEAAFAAVSEEVQKLPEAQRTAFVLCCIEGRATTEAAASLGQKLGTFSARLTRAKQTLLDRLAKRGLGASILALGGITGTVAVAPAALIERTLALVPSGVTIPSSVLALTQGVTGMMMLRFKLLAAGVMVATGLGLSFGGGWSGEAAAQYVRETPATKSAPPKGDANVEKLKADLERARFALFEAEAEARLAVERDTQIKRLGRELDLPVKYEYEPVPKEGLTDFEERLAKREKAGWSFVGQVTIKGFGPEEKLVFRKLPAPPKATGFNPAVAPPGWMMPPKATEVPPAPTHPGGMLPPKATDPTEKVDPLNRGFGLPGKPPVAPGSPPPPGAAPAPAISIPVEWSRDAERIAKLEADLKAMMAQVEALRSELKMRPKSAEKPEPVLWHTVSFTKKDYGAWDPVDLMEVLVKLLAEDAKEAKTRGQISLVKEQDGFTVSGTAETVAAAKEWVRKLKK